MPTREEERKQLLERANALPLCPGVYIMKDREGRVIYVGKSRKLKNRVSQYFQNSEKNLKTARMVASVRDFEYFLCDTEMEALTLENTLIKQHNPKYNIRLKDAKSYPYIKITDEPYPRLIMTRKRDKDKGKYFGPYSGVSTVFSVLDTLRRVLALPTCNRRFPRDIGKERPCLYYQMGRCCGPCTGKVSEEEYAITVSMAADILRGHTGEVKKRLAEQMYAHAEEERFEAAARCRDTITALDRLREKQTVVAAPDTEQDVIGYYGDEVTACVSVFYIRGGAVVDKDEFPAGGERILDEESLGAFICEHYRVREYIPKQILLAFSLEEEELEGLSQYLSEMAGHKVTVRIPERGQAHTLCELVRSNAAEKVRQYRLEAEKDEGALARLAEILELPTYPTRIEAYDISNLGVEHLTAGMVVCEDGKFNKSDYRYFKIKSVEGTTDDYASMREALDRRLSHLEDGEGAFGKLPDLILLDGGRGHVGVVRELMEEQGLDIPVFGMVKDDFHKTRALCTEDGEISIAKENAVFLLIYRIQEEVHRFTVSRMDAAKRKTLTHSSLTKIKGIGDAKAKALLAAFGGITGVKNATVDELAAVKGISRGDAVNIRAYYDGKQT
ncbi:MAG: excinuclease ABC subunit UvrC [Ruminococcaceae bacterium]|nr:excinuclease ABC subunit UvrC [Oscillospiraceae bacterium]